MIYQVTNFNDFGSGSLREGILNGNKYPKSIINFSVSGTIFLINPLPDITTQIAIDRSSAPSFNGSPVVVIDFCGMPGLILSKLVMRKGLSF